MLYNHGLRHLTELITLATQSCNLPARGPAGGVQQSVGDGEGGAAAP